MKICIWSHAKNKWVAYPVVNFVGTVLMTFTIIKYSNLSENLSYFNTLYEHQNNTVMRELELGCGETLKCDVLLAAFAPG
jgi:hypothetical protein